MTLLLAARAAVAGACCAGTSVDAPATLGSCEQFGAALALGATSEAGRWGADGAWWDSSEAWTRATATLAIAGRWAAWGQAGVALPVVVTAREAGGWASSGGGPGDALVTARLEPWSERPGGFRPVPVLQLGLMVPTGRGDEASTDPLLADVTGQGEWQPVLGIGLQRTLAAWPLRAGVSWSGVPGEAHANLAASVSVARSIGARWTAGGAWSARWWPSLGAVRQGADLQLVTGDPRAWRAWLSVGADPPVAAFGRESHAEVRVGLGVMLFATE